MIWKDDLMLVTTKTYKTKQKQQKTALYPANKANYKSKDKCPNERHELLYAVITQVQKLLLLPERNIITKSKYLVLLHLLSGVTLSFLGHPDRLRRKHEKCLSQSFILMFTISASWV